MFNVNRFCKALEQAYPEITQELTKLQVLNGSGFERSDKINGISVNAADTEKAVVSFSKLATEEEINKVEEFLESWYNRPDPDWNAFYKELSLEVIEAVMDSEFGAVIISRLATIPLVDPLALEENDLLFRVWNQDPPDMEDIGADFFALADKYNIPLTLIDEKLALRW